MKFAVEETKEAKAITQKPKFVNNNENAKISNAQKGTLIRLLVLEFFMLYILLFHSFSEHINALKFLFVHC